ncbi:MAG: Fic family protein [Bacteroidota bacterium]
MKKITVGDWRKDIAGPMQVVSGSMGKEKVHFQAPLAIDLENEMDRFISWFNNEGELEPVLKSGIAHIWFITIHPFDDGNGRIARAIADMQLARADMTNQRFYSMSAQIERKKKFYYDILKETQKGSMDITSWLLWYLKCLAEALEVTD